MNRFLKTIVTVTLLITFLVSTAAPLVAQAQFGGAQGNAQKSTQKNFEDGVVMCAATAVALYLIGLIPSISVPTVDTPALLKKAIFDCVFWAFKNAIIQEMTGSTIQWVQTGMNGNPAFVQDLNGYLRSLADYVAADYIEENLPFLCSPFRAEIQLQLTQMYQSTSGRGTRLSCSLGDVIDNVEGFLEGDFYAGGWDGWVSMFINPYNNPYGSSIHSASELYLRVSATTNQGREEIRLGDGFLSKKTQQCYWLDVDEAGRPTSGPGQGFTIRDGQTRQQALDDAGISGLGSVVCEEPKITTPGSQIKTSLEQALNINLDNIANADEFNEIFSLLALWIVSDILTQDEGLAGYDPSKSNARIPDVTIPNIEDPGGSTTPRDSEQPGPPGPSMCFVNNGTFIPQRERVGHGNAFGKVSFPVPQNVSYDRIVFEIDVKNTGWRPLEEQPPTPKGTRPWVYNIFYMPRIPGSLDVFGYINVRGPEGPSNYTNKVIAQHGVGQGWNYKPSTVSNLNFPVGSTYRFTYVYDAQNDVIALGVTDTATNERTGGLQTVPDAEINIGNKRFVADIGFPTQSGNIYDTPSYGWEYSNLKVQFLSEGDAPGACANVPINGAVSGSAGASGGGGPGGGGSPPIQDWDVSDTPIRDGQGGGGAGPTAGGGGVVGGGGICSITPWLPWCGGGGDTGGGSGGGGGGGTGPGGEPGGGGGECTDLNCSPPQI